MGSSQVYRNPTWKSLFSKFKNASQSKSLESRLQSLENGGYKVSFLGSSSAKAHWNEQVKQNSLGLRDKDLPTTTFAMVITNPDGRVVDSRELLPTPIFASKGVEVCEKSILITETGESAEYGILTLSAKLYKIGIIRTSNLYLREETPHYVHLPSELWQLIADSENEIKDFGSEPPVRTWLTSKGTAREGNDLTPKKFDPSRRVPDIDHDNFRFGIHFKPPPGLCRKSAYIFCVKH